MLRTLRSWLPLLSRHPLKVAGIGLLTAAITAVAVAQTAQKPLTPDERRALDRLGEQIRDNQKKSETNRADARQIAGQIEDLRKQIINMSRSESVSEKRAAIYRARLETINVMEADLTRKLGALRAKEARLLSALQTYSRNPPPAIFVSTRKANDAVLAAILMKSITPALRERAAGLAEENRTLIRLRREAQLNTGALFISESEIAEQRSRIETLIRQRAQLEDQLLSDANKLDAERRHLSQEAVRISGNKGILAALGLTGRSGNQALKLKPPVVGKTVSEFKRADNSETFGKGMTISTEPDASVTAPGDGQVEYAGPLGSYGQVVILRVSEDYRVVITGLGRIYVETGTNVRQGEPLGRMNNTAKEKPLLYLELRKADTPVNPRQAFVFGA